MDPKKQQILKSAKSLFLGQGFKTTTMQAVADAAGMSKGALYLQFASKKDIFFEILIQSDDQMLRRVQAIRSESQLSARDRMMQIIQVYFEFIHENRLLSELYMHEVGLELTEEMLTQAEISRLRWQSAIDECVGELVGPDCERWKADLGFTVTGVVECFHANLLVGRVKISEDAMRAYLLLLVETMAPALKKASLRPMIDPDSIEKRHEALEDLDQKRDREVRSLLAKMSSVLEGRSESGDSSPQLQIQLESVRVIEREYAAEDPNKAIIQGMLAGLRQIPEFSMYRQQLADLLGVTLV